MRTAQLIEAEVTCDRHHHDANGTSFAFAQFHCQAPGVRAVVGYASQVTIQAKPIHGDGKEALLAAVVDVVGELGLRALTYRKVAERAGVANTLITHHFGSREALLAAALVWATEQTLGLADISDEGTFGEDFADRFVDLVSANANLQFFQYEMLLAARQQSEARRRMEGLYAKYMDALASGFARRGFQDPELLGRVFFAAMDGLVMQQLTFGNEHEIRRGFIMLGRLLASTPRDVSVP